MKNNRRPGTQGCGIEKSADSTSIDFEPAADAAAEPAGVKSPAGIGKGVFPLGAGAGAVTGGTGGDRGAART